MDYQTIESNRSNVLKHFNKSEEDFERDVNIILTTLKQYAHFPKIPETNLKNKVEVYLISNKFNIEKTKEKLDFCYTSRNFYAEFFDNWDPCSDENKEIFGIYQYVPLPQRSKDLQRVTLINFAHKIEDYDLIECMKIILMSLETQMSYGHVMGDIWIKDCSKASIKAIKRFTPSVIKKIVDICLKGYSIRVSAVHLLFAPNAISTILNLLKVVLKPKIYERIHIHKNLESLHKKVSKDYLPKNWGGNLPSTDTLTDSWYSILRNNRLNLIEESKLRTDETKRIHELNEDAFFGSMHGTFKKLDFD